MLQKIVIVILKEVRMVFALVFGLILYVVMQSIAIYRLFIEPLFW